jgi:hypothetical protein
VVHKPITVEAEQQGYTLSALEAHYDQIALFEECDLVVAFDPDDLGSILTIGTAYGLRKQIIIFNPRGKPLPQGLSVGYVMLNITAGNLSSATTPFMLSLREGPHTPGTTESGDLSAVSLVYEAMVDLCLDRVVTSLEKLRDVYTSPHPQHEMVYQIAYALRSKWEEPDAGKKRNTDSLRN